MNAIVKKLGKKITGEIKVPGDKSISIRASIISSLFFGDYNIKNFNFCDDTKACIDSMKKLAIFSKNDNKTLTLDCKNSATTMRLLSGYICGAFSGMDKKIKLTGDNSLKKRPMNRIIDPLKQMGACIESRTNGTAPLYIDLSKCRLHDLTYKSSIASAQVKSCLELAAYTSGAKLRYYEPYKTRDHTSIMLNYMHDLEHHHNNCHDKKCACHNLSYEIPSDTSTASIFITNAIIYNGSNICIKKVLMNDKRIGFFDALAKIGIKLIYKNKCYMQNEKVCDIHFKNKNIKLKSISVNKKDIPSMIDEITLLALLLAKADGISHIYGLEELRKKESDRLDAIVNILNVYNIKSKIRNSNLTIYGNKNLDYKINENTLSKCQKESLKKLQNTKDHRILFLLKILNIKCKNEKFLNVSI